VRHELATSLNNASNQYSDLARLETTSEGRRAWVTKAVEAVEESVAIHRGLSGGGDLASSLNSASNRYSELAGLETTREGRGLWLTRAVEAVEEAVGIWRELGVGGDLAMSLGALGQHQRSLAEAEVDPAEAERWLTRSREVIDEAVALFREAGNTPYLLMSLQDAVVARVMLARAGAGVDAEELMGLVDEGLGLGRSMEDEGAVEFFSGVKRKLSEGGEG
jgi:hypothetical protein